MKYIYVVMYQAAQYEESIPVRAFQSEESAQAYIDCEEKLQPKLTGCFYIEDIALDDN